MGATGKRAGGLRKEGLKGRKFIGGVEERPWFKVRRDSQKDAGVQNEFKFQPLGFFRINPLNKAS